MCLLPRAFASLVRSHEGLQSVYSFSFFIFFTETAYTAKTHTANFVNRC